MGNLKMKCILYVCFILFIIDKGTGQTVDPACDSVLDFSPCWTNGDCNVKVSRCICVEGQQVCQCNTRKGEFYLDQDCSQRWTVVTFALVASLPGLTLAVLVGVIVYVVMLSLNQSEKGRKVKTPNTAAKEQGLFPGITFASDMNGRPPANMKPAQVIMTTMPNRPYSMSSGTRDPPMGGPAQPYSVSGGIRDPQMGGPARAFSPSSSIRPSADSVTDVRPREPNSMYSGMRDPPMGGPVQPYSSGTGRGQVVNNPYARDSPNRNPYEDHHSEYRPRAPSHTYDNMKQSQPYSPAPHYGSPEQGNVRSGFPRPQLNLQY